MNDYRTKTKTLKSPRHRIFSLITIMFKPLVNAHPFSQGSPSQPPSLMSFWMTVFLTDTKDYEAGKINTSAES